MARIHHRMPVLLDTDTLAALGLGRDPAGSPAALAEPRRRVHRRAPATERNSIGALACAAATMTTKYAAQLVCALSVTLGFGAQARAQEQAQTQAEGPAQAEEQELVQAQATEVSVCTDLGALTIELHDEESPLHTANFLEYIDQGYYSGTVFHRVIEGFMVQGGGFDRQLDRKPVLAPVINESGNGLGNLRGTVAAARTNDPNSATAQFFINLVDNDQLDASVGSPGYTVFGQVTEGMEIVDTIGALPTSGVGPFASDVPDPLVAVTSMARLDREVMASLPEDARTITIRERVGEALDAGNQVDVLEWIGHYRATCAVMDPDLLFLEASSAAALLRAARAQSALDEFFTLASETHADYAAAVELYARVAPDFQPTIARMIDECDPPTLPEIPDGSVADYDAMLAGRDDVQEFIGAGDTYLACLSDVIDAEDLSDEEHSLAVREHNRMVAVMEQLAEDFNDQLRAYRDRE